MSVRNMACICTVCGSEVQVGFDVDFLPDINSTVERMCSKCGCKQTLRFRETKKLRAQRRRIQEDQELRDHITQLAEQYGFKCCFIYQHVTVTTPVGSWQFNLYGSKKKLFHESSYKVNLQTGNKAFWHLQFERKMSLEELFLYVSNHEKAHIRRLNNK